MSKLNLNKLKLKRRTICLLSIIILVFSTQSAKADVPGLPPAGNVSCSTTDEGMNFGIDMTFTNSITITDWSYIWMYSKFVSGAPNLVRSYGPPKLLRSTTVNGLRLSYSEILSLVDGDSNATILVTAGVRNGSVTNATGRGCFFELPAVLEEVKQAEAAKLALVINETKITNDLAEQLLMETAKVDKVSEEVEKAIIDITSTYNLFSKAISDIRGQITSLTAFVIKVRERVKA